MVYMTEKLINKTFRIPENLSKKFRKLIPSRENISPKVSGAMLLYFLVKPNIQDMVEEAAYSDNIESSLADLSKKIKVELSESADNQQLRNIIIDILKEYKLISGDEPEPKLPSVPVSAEKLQADEQSNRKTRSPRRGKIG